MQIKEKQIQINILHTTLIIYTYIRPSKDISIYFLQKPSNFNSKLFLPKNRFVNSVLEYVGLHKFYMKTLLKKCRTICVLFKVIGSNSVYYTP